MTSKHYFVCCMCGTKNQTPEAAEKCCEGIAEEFRLQEDGEYYIVPPSYIRGAE